MALFVLPALLFVACAPAPDGLSGDEELGVLPGDRGVEDGAGGMNDDAGGAVGSGTVAASVSGWIATAVVLPDADAAIAAGTLSAHAGGGVVVCQHSDLVAPCGTLAGTDGFAWDASTSTGTFRYRLTSDGTDTMCRWTVSYALLGVDAGTLDVYVDADGSVLDGAATTVTIAPDASR